MISMPGSYIPGKIRVLALMALTVFVWILVVMVYTERFFPPFDRLELLLMPWKKLYAFWKMTLCSTRAEAPLLP